ncbi:MAG: hypothetical protein U1D30_07000 [Planctomycetota bacterium]
MASINNSTDKLKLDYYTDASGTATIVVRAEDIAGLFIDVAFTVTVTRPPDTPISAVDIYATELNTNL